MEDLDNVIAETKLMIRQFVDDFCNENVSFYVCQLASTEKGYEQLEQFVLQRMAKGDTIARAINLKERILDPNRLVD
tara:strand:+ start:2890 stop:3120 length:231 start_codon:yes stop_codon:yes gene_type:complete